MTITDLVGELSGIAVIGYLATAALNDRRHASLLGFSGENGEKAYSTTLSSHRYVEVGVGDKKIYAEIRSFPIEVFKPRIRYEDTNMDGNVDLIIENPGILKPARRLRLEREKHGEEYEIRFRRADREFKEMLDLFHLVVIKETPIPGKVININSRRNGKRK